MSSKTYKFGEFQLEEERRRLLRNGDPVTVSSRSFDLLVCLINNAGKLVSREELFRTVWGEDSNTSDEVLTDAMSKLRAALLDDEKPYKIIGTVHRKGYQFIAPFETVTNEAGAQPEISLEGPVPKPLNFKDWLGRSGVKWLFRAIVIFTILASIISQQNRVALLIGSVSNILLAVTALIYYWGYSRHRLKNFRPFSRDIASDNLKSDVGDATKSSDKLYWESTRENARDGSAIFRACWQVLLIIWIFLYILLAIKTKDDYWLGLFITFCNNLNTIVLAICFYTFNTLEKGRKELRENAFWLIGFGLIAALALIEAASLYNSQAIAGFFNLIGGANNPVSKDDISWFFRAISGVGGAIALALFVGRLQSKFFNPATKFIVIFYSYIAIQPLFVFFDDRSVTTAIVIHIALALKYFLFLYLFWALESGRLLFYLVRVRQTNREVEEEWQKFQIVFENNSIGR